MGLRPKHISPALLVILAEGFLSRLSFGIISFALPLYARQLGLSLTEIGVLFSLGAAAEQAAKPLMGWAADRIGLKRSYTLAIGLRSLVALLLVFAQAPWQLYAIRLVHGVSESLRDPSVNALIAENGRARNLASSFAWYATAKTAAGSVGKALTGFLLAWPAYNYSRAFLMAFALSGLPLYVVARYIHESSSHEIANVELKVEKTSSPTSSEPINRTPLFPFVLLGFLIAGTAHMLHSLFPILAVEYGGLSAAEIGVIYTLSIPVIVAAGPAFGWLSDNISRKLVLMTRGVCNIFSSLIYLFFPSFAGLTTGHVVDGVGKAAFRPAWGALMAQVSSSDRRRRARTIGYLSFGEGAGEMVGPILAGLLWSAWGLPVVLGLRVLLALFTEVYAIVVSRLAEKNEWYRAAGGDTIRRAERFAYSETRSSEPSQ
ncbi:MAG TPA: MFS transporter [Blastocatellia bacterium]|nr:MFS transporter [Blastocatellia bacterium]